MSEVFMPGGRGIPSLSPMSCGSWPLLIALCLVLVTLQGARGFEIGNPLAKSVPDLNSFNAFGGTKPLSGGPDPLKMVRDLYFTCERLENIARATQEKVDQERTSFWSTVRSAATNLGPNDKKILLYEFAAEAKFTYNIEAGTAWYEFILPSGVKVEKGKSEASKEGNYSIPNMDPKALVRETGFVKAEIQNTYAAWASKKKEDQPNRYVYVASKRFVDFLAASNVLQEVGWAIFTEGSTAQGSVDALKELLLLEWADILNWLQEVGKDSSEKLADEIVKAVLNNGYKTGPIHLPDFDLDGEVETTEYRYDIKLALSGELARTLSLVYDTSKPIAKIDEIKLPHLTFWFSIPKPPTSEPIDDKERDKKREEHFVALLRKFLDLLQKGPEMEADKLAHKLSTMLDIEEKRAKSAFDPDGDIRAKFVKALSNAFAEGRERHKGGGVFDFSDTKGARDLAESLNGLMIGKASVARVKSLLVDVVSESVSVEVDLTSKEELTKDQILSAFNVIWKENEKQKSKVFHDTLSNAGAACDKVSEECQRLLKKLKISSPVCGRSGNYQTLKLNPLSDPLSDPKTRLPVVGQGNYLFKLSSDDPRNILTTPFGMLDIEYIDETGKGPWTSCAAIVISNEYVLTETYCAKLVVNDHFGAANQSS